MKKVFVNVKLDDNQKQRLENISDEFEFVYQPDKDAQIIIGSYPVNKLKEFNNLEWIQTNSAGYENYVMPGILNDNVILTNAADVHSQEVAEHAFAMMLMMIKNLYLYRDNQKEHKWNNEGKIKEINKLKVCIVGLGDIGTYLARTLKNNNIYVIGVKRKAINKPDYIDELYLEEELDKAISDVDVVFTILPAYPGNIHLFDIETFKKMRKDSILINVGRGNLYSEETLMYVLDNNIIKAIGMDVFETEPIPKDSKLWDYKNLVITPHVAGFFHTDSAFEKYLDLVETNLRRYINNQELLNVIKR